MSELTNLSTPGPELYDAWADAIAEYDGVGLDGSGSWRVTDFGPDLASFESLMEIIRSEGDLSSRMPEGFVHCTYWWLTDPEQQVIGFLALRHSIDTEFLSRAGGHIGYSVRPSRRRQGHASRALGLALEKARDLGLDRVLLTCDLDNEGSARTIEGQGGVFENIIGDKRRYWIDLG